MRDEDDLQNQRKVDKSKFSLSLAPACSYQTPCTLYTPPKTFKVAGLSVSFKTVLKKVRNEWQVAKVVRKAATSEYVVRLLPIRSD